MAVAMRDPTAAGRLRGARRVPGRGLLATVRGHASLRLGTALLALLLVGSVVGSLVLVDPTAQNLADTLQSPSAAHPFGTDPIGRDVLAWVCGGIRVSLLVAFGVVALSALVGVTVGLLAGYAGGVLDTILMRLVDMQLAVPPLILFIAVSAVVQPTLLTMILLLSLFMWVPYARLVRTVVLVERERGFVAAARLLGAGRLRVMAVHLLPATATPTIVYGSLQLGYVFLSEAGLSFLGLGVRPPQTSLGYMISQGRSMLVDAWWLMLFPGLTIILLILATNLIGDGLRDLFRLDVEGDAAERRDA